MRALLLILLALSGCCPNVHPDANGTIPWHTKR